MYVPVRLHPKCNGSGWAGGWGVGGVSVGWDRGGAFFSPPLHTLKRSGSHLKHVFYSSLTVWVLAAPEEKTLIGV